MAPQPRRVSVELQPVGRRAAVTGAQTASGPAFEGAHISNGMRAAAGAIELARKAHYLELTTHPAFEAHFVKAIGF